MQASREGTKAGRQAGMKTANTEVSQTGKKERQQERWKKARKVDKQERKK